MWQLSILHCLAQSFGLRERIAYLAFRHQTDKLFATIAGNKIVGAMHLSQQGLGYRLQANITSLVAVVVVVAFEEVDVDHQQPQGLAATQESRS